MVWWRRVQPIQRRRSLGTVNRVCFDIGWCEHNHYRLMSPCSETSSETTILGNGHLSCRNGQ